MTSGHDTRRRPALHWGADGAGSGPVDERDDAGYADLRSYAAIGDGRTVALVARDGRIDWLPLPEMDGAPVFGALLDAEQGGYVELRPVEESTVRRAYVAHTNVLTTTFTTASGSVRVTDSLNSGVAGRLPWSELARRIEGVDGHVEMRAAVRPGTCLNTASPWVHQTAHGAVLRVDDLTLAVRTLGADSVDDGDRRIDVVFRTAPGSRHLLGLVATESEPLFLPAAEAIDAGVDRTIENWAAWMRSFDWDGPWDTAVRRSALTLKLLVHAASGSMVAAATTSLPESPGGGKNWDYRYAWVRDSAYALTALFRFGLREETHGAISWLLSTIRQHGPEPQVVYALDGGLVPTAEFRDVPGWRGAAPVVSGNNAAGQLQLGVFGDLFSIVALYVEHGNVLDAHTGRLLAGVADLACDRWRSKDSGMWELPEHRHYTTSKLGCWMALTKAVELAESGQIPGDDARWRSEAEHIREWVEQNCWSDERGAYVWYPGTDQLDASIVLHAISGFDRGERMSSTLDALRAELGAGPHLYRFTGAAEEEGVFLACSFWLVSALALCGRVEEARGLMDELMSTPNDVGLLSEMLDPATGDLLGNLPQALSHLALVNAAITVAEASSPG
ncbi:glycoside hydrolase family 15 protein [Modestobacter sp. VKM Ac-2979]|uniref:glycoside hydrolase family 15 protein n=1 Tax=unclassified Modestobacter TaxID=2643866 RepID=UPI0022ABA292|nr:MULTISPECIES: glycoside hydrolase family 15 protein [unclassified Modestobacter]MCZ2813792.1 glycoside hydrolase family 15 protein [Modestobacter sp. VKM Ac-2979]MCZ2844233.1 glycoside hydrolase family 15 protein [Modestobacter sp. VKM Ac-2980]